MTKSNRLYSVMKLLTLPSSLSLAPIKFTKTEDDIFFALHDGKFHHLFSPIFATILSVIYFKVKIYEGLKLGRNFFIYIRSLSTIVEIACLVGSMMCYNFGARKTVRIYKKMKKIIKSHFTEADYKCMRRLFVLEVMFPSILLTMQLMCYCYFYLHPSIFILFIMDSNIAVLTFSTCLRHYNMARILQICFDKLIKKLEQPINSKQLHQIWSSYLEIHSVTKTVNEIFGFSLSCSLAVLYIYCLVALFGICSFVTKAQSAALANCLWFCEEICQFLVVVFGTSSCEVSARKLQARLGCYEGEDDHAEEVSGRYSLCV